MYFIVLDEKKNSHLIEASSPGLAITKVPGGESVRLATGREINQKLDSESKKK